MSGGISGGYSSGYRFNALKNALGRLDALEQKKGKVTDPEVERESLRQAFAGANISLEHGTMKADYTGQQRNISSENVEQLFSDLFSEEGNIDRKSLETIASIAKEAINIDAKTSIPGRSQQFQDDMIAAARSTGTAIKKGGKAAGEGIIWVGQKVGAGITWGALGVGALIYYIGKGVIHDIPIWVGDRLVKLGEKINAATYWITDHLVGVKIDFAERKVLNGYLQEIDDEAKAIQSALHEVYLDAREAAHQEENGSPVKAANPLPREEFVYRQPVELKWMGDYLNYDVANSTSRIRREEIVYRVQVLLERLGSEVEATGTFVNKDLNGLYSPRSGDREGQLGELEAAYQKRLGDSYTARIKKLNASYAERGITPPDMTSPQVVELLGRVEAQPPLSSSPNSPTERPRRGSQDVGEGGPTQWPQGGNPSNV